MIFDGALLRKSRHARGAAPRAPRHIFGPMKMGGEFIRAGVQGDAAACAAIMNAWIDGCGWMPRVHDADDVLRHYREFVFAKRAVFVTGAPVAGYLALDEGCSEVTSLFVAEPGHGVGKGLLDHAKAGRDQLELWTFVANEGARRFYGREGFSELRRTDGDNEEGLPDVLLRWERG